MKKISIRQINITIGLVAAVLMAGYLYYTNIISADIRGNQLIHIQGQVQESIDNQLKPITNSVELNLKNSSQNIIATAETSPNGLYNFTNLAQGSYSIETTDNTIYFSFVIPTITNVNNVETYNLIKHSQSSYQLDTAVSGTAGNIIGLTKSDHKWVDISLPVSLLLTNVVGISQSDSKFIVGSDRGRLFKTVNGGVSWREVTPDYITGIKENIGLQVSADGSTIVATDDALKTFYVSSNEGETWQQFKTSFPLLSVYFSDKNNGIALSAFQIYRTSNGGRSWGVERIISTQSAVSCNKTETTEDAEKTLWSWDPQGDPPIVVGHNGYILKYNSSEKYWESSSPYTYWCLNAVSSTQKNFAMVGGAHGILKRGEGDSYTTINNYPNINIIDIAMKNIYEGYMLKGSGNSEDDEHLDMNGNLFYTNSGGSQWKNVDTLLGYRYLDIYTKKMNSSFGSTYLPIDLPDIWIATNDGIWFSLAADSDDWQRTPTGITSELNKLSLFPLSSPTQTGFALSTRAELTDMFGSVMTKTIEGGYSWKLISNSDYSWTDAIMFDEKSAWLLGINQDKHEGSVLLTKDRGETMSEKYTYSYDDENYEYNRLQTSGDYTIATSSILGTLRNNKILVMNNNSEVVTQKSITINPDLINYNVMLLSDGTIIDLTSDGIYTGNISQASNIISLSKTSDYRIGNINKNIFSVSLRDDSVWLMAENGLNIVEDKGNFWSAEISEPFEHSKITSIFSLSKDVAWIGGRNGEVYYTQDRGETWHDISFKRERINKIIVNNDYNGQNITLNSPPDVYLTNPEQGTNRTVNLKKNQSSAKGILKATASDSDGIKEVLFYNDSEQIGSDTSPNQKGDYTLEVVLTANQIYKFSAIAVDNKGKKSAQTPIATVTVNKKK